MSAGYRLGERVEDFLVEEVPLFAPCGEGGHTFVRVEKRDLTTEQVVRILAREAGVRPRDVGYAGRKDRRAIAIQWLSVPGFAPDAALAVQGPRLRVLEAVPHAHKLRTGALRANRFRLRVRDVDAVARERAPARLDELVERGMPNRFGPQRFGPRGDNAERGRALLATGRPPRDRRAGRFLLSALQAAVFNQVLARRSEPPWQLVTGDVARVEESGGLFVVEDAAREQPRADAFLVSPTGPIPGSRMLRAEGAPGALEASVLAEQGFGEGAALPGIRLRGARRALRVRPAEAGLAVCDDALELRFELPAGSFATVLVEELLGPGSTSPPGIAYPPPARAASKEEPRQ